MSPPPPPPDDLAAHPVDAETALAHHPPGHKDELRLWLRLLATTNLIEGEIRRRLRVRFDTTLPRFDLLAQLHRAGADGLTLGDISRRMMVSNGNVTGLAARLEAEGLIERRAHATDRRAQTLRLTPKGRRDFARQSAVHEDWIAELFAGLSSSEGEELFRLLARAKQSARAALAEDEA
jgi:DNA-binding MarR family transcriptional regulator